MVLNAGAVDIAPSLSFAGPARACLSLASVFVDLGVTHDRDDCELPDMGCKKLWRKSITLATTLRRCGDAIWWKFGKKQSYTHGFCHGNMRTREAGWKIDHRLRTFQLNVSFVFFFDFHLLLS